MPGVIPKRSSCGHEYVAIDSISLKDEDLTRCPKCLGTDLTKLIAAHADFRGNGQMTLEECKARGDYGMVMKNKKHLEDNSDKIMSGEWGVQEAGPPELRPQLPESMRTRYY